jgi:peptide chain release factor 3
VGQLQFEVLVDRLSREYGVDVTLDRLPYRAARWVSGPGAEVAKLDTGYGIKRVQDADGRPMVLFETEWSLERAISREKRVLFEDVQPRAGGRGSAGAHVGAAKDG